MNYVRKLIPIAFIIAFAGIGGYSLYKTFAATERTANIEAETFSHARGALRITSSTASANQAIRMKSNGTVQKNGRHIK